MASAREERERRREARLEAERQEARGQRRRLIAGYLVAGVLCAALLAGLFAVIVSSDGGRDPEVEDAPTARIDTTVGVVAAKPDNRAGVSPPAVEQGDLEKAAEVAAAS